MWKERVHDLPSFSWKTPVTNANAAGYPLNSSLAKKASKQGQLTQTSNEGDELQPLSKREPWDLNIVRVLRFFHDETEEMGYRELHGGPLIFPLPDLVGPFEGINNSPDLTWPYIPIAY
jgi:hypothetical protein